MELSMKTQWNSVHDEFTRSALRSTIDSMADKIKMPSDVLIRVVQEGMNPEHVRLMCVHINGGYMAGNQNLYLDFYAKDFRAYEIAPASSPAALILRNIEEFLRKIKATGERVECAGSETRPTSRSGL
jgi:hypothetical protein